MNNVNKGRLELRTFDPDKDFPAAQAVAAASAGGKNPFATQTGDFKRHYLLDAASEILPYRMYVPTSYNGTRALPADHRAARTRRHRRQFLRRLRPQVPRPRRAARLHRGRAAGLPRRRRLWVGRWQPAGRCDDAAAAGSERAGRDARAGARAQAVQDRRQPHLPDRALARRDRHLEDGAEISGHLGGHRAVLGFGRARPRWSASRRSPNSSCMATPIRPSTCAARARWWRR